MFTVSFCTPCKVQVGARVKEGGGEAQEQYLQESAMAPMPPPFLQLLPQLQYFGVFVFSRALLKYHDNFQYQLTIRDDIYKYASIFGDQLCQLIWKHALLAALL